MTKSSSSSARISQLVLQMRDDIRFGAFTFGQWLKLVELQDRYDAKQFEMRKVLNELKTLRLVEHRQNSGFYVATPDPAEREQMRFVRVVLERSAAPLIAARATAEDIIDLRRLATEFQETIRLDGRQFQAAANIAFHDRLAKVTGNSVLARLIHDLREQSHYGTTGRWRSDEGLQESAREHFSMIDAIEKRDPVELERQATRHIESF